MNYAVLLTICIALVTAILQGCTAAVVAGAAGGATVAHDRRTAGRFVDDQTLELKAEGRIREDKSLHNVRVNVTSMNGIVLVTGEAPTKALRNRALAHIRSVEGVRRIHNHIRLAKRRSFDDLTHDKWVTTKIKTKQTTKKGADPTRVKVVTSNSVVYLMGLVTRKEADASTSIARETKGVIKVVRLFEYID
ncbi:MAG: BON domain-containing protein [Acidiferrobacterales bacterium]